MAVKPISAAIGRAKGGDVREINTQRVDLRPNVNVFEPTWVRIKNTTEDQWWGFTRAIHLEGQDPPAQDQSEWVWLAPNTEIEIRGPAVGNVTTLRGIDTEPYVPEAHDPDGIPPMTALDKAGRFAKDYWWAVLILLILLLVLGIALAGGGGDDWLLYL